MTNGHAKAAFANRDLREFNFRPESLQTRSTARPQFNSLSPCNYFFSSPIFPHFLLLSARTVHCHHLDSAVAVAQPSNHVCLVSHRANAF